MEFDNSVWTIPSSRMKTGREHRIPLSSSAMRILRVMLPANRSEYVFPSPRGDSQLSHIVLQRVMSKLGANFTVHGFRSSLRDWAGDETSFPREVCEGVLAHVVGGVEGAYRRSDALEKRRALLVAWANYVDGWARAENVVPITAGTK